MEADLLIIFSDIDGLYTDDPHSNPQAQFISMVTQLDDHLMQLGKGSVSSVGTGGMETKLHAARTAAEAGVDMVIANGADFHNLHRILSGAPLGTLFVAPHSR